MIDNIVDWWRSFFEHPTFWDAFWPAVLGALAGAVMAFVLERRYRERDRVSREVGQCNRLIFTLGQTLSVLEDFNDLLFVGPRKQLGREPNWHEIGSLPGAPQSGPPFIVGEFDFLLEDGDRKSKAPSALGRVYTAASRFSSVLAMVHEHSRHFDQWRRLGTLVTHGVEAATANAERDASRNRLEQLTRILSEDIPEAIALFKEVIPELLAILKTRYPRRRFISLWPKDTDAPPV